jgi:hypothetical protein
MGRVCLALNAASYQWLSHSPPMAPQLNRREPSRSPDVPVIASPKNGAADEAAPTLTRLWHGAVARGVGRKETTKKSEPSHRLGPGLYAQCNGLLIQRSTNR